MEISSMNRRKLIRYFSNPTHFFSLSQRHPLSLPAQKTLKPSFSATLPNPTFHSLQPQSNPLTTSVYSLISSTGSPSVSPQTPPILQILICCNGLLRPQSLSRLFSVSSASYGGFENLGCVGSDDSDLTKRGVNGFGSKLIPKQGLENVELIGSDEDTIESVGCEDSQVKDRNVDRVEPNVRSKQVLEIVELIRREKDDPESKLKQLGAENLCLRYICEVFRVLNRDRLSGLDLFRCIRDSNAKPFQDFDVCSLIINNCGWLDDYDTMIDLLKDFKADGVHLSVKAFEFLLFLDSNEASVKQSVERVIRVLNEAGGSCRGTGIFSLIKMFSAADLDEMAKFVMEITKREVSYYDVLVLEKCRKGHFEEALALLEEMRQFGCEPNIKTYNYLLSTLCKNERLAEACRLLEEIQEKGCQLNVLTFEIFIYYLCKHGKMDSAVQFLDHMVSAGLEPRLTTHAAFIKGYFNLGKYEEAYRYVIEAGDKYNPSSAMNFSLLADLHVKEKHINSARNILIEMMDKGLRPNFSVYKRILKQLYKPGRKRELARDLQGRFSRLRSM